MDQRNGLTAPNGTPPEPAIREGLLFHPDVKKHGFQYIDWQFDNRDIIFLSRTAFDDEFGGANNFHDANYLTFHRIKNFRRLQKDDLDNH